jgi:hypothetical protein
MAASAFVNENVDERKSFTDDEIEEGKTAMMMKISKDNDLPPDVVEKSIQVSEILKDAYRDENHNENQIPLLDIMGSCMVLSVKKIMWIRASSADIERLFSLATFVISKKRKIK